jgi:phage terminase large subunit GpA-like protein
VLIGDPYHAEVWHELDRLLDEPFRHGLGGHLVIGRMAVDAGFATQAVYGWTATKPLARVMAVKGSTRQAATVGSPSKVEVTAGGRRMNSGAKIWPVNVDIFKAELYGRLRLEPPREEGDEAPPGLCHFPQYEVEYFKQLTAEQQVERKDRRGFPVREWQKIRARNEALDARVYATAAAYVAGVLRWKEGRWDELRKIALSGAPPERRAETKTPPDNDWLGGRAKDWFR